MQTDGGAVERGGKVVDLGVGLVDRGGGCREPCGHWRRLGKGDVDNIVGQLHCNVPAFEPRQPPVGPAQDVLAVGSFVDVDGLTVRGERRNVDQHLTEVLKVRS